jgi:hypothetical protein
MCVARRHRHLQGRSERISKNIFDQQKIRADDGNRTRMTSLEVRALGLVADLYERQSWPSASTLSVSDRSAPLGTPALDDALGREGACALLAGVQARAQPGQGAAEAGSLRRPRLSSGHLSFAQELPGPVLRELILRPDTPLDPAVKEMIASQLDGAEARFAAITD